MCSAQDHYHRLGRQIYGQSAKWHILQVYIDNRVSGLFGSSTYRVMLSATLELTQTNEMEDDE